MASKHKNCGDKHRFREHGIGAGLTRKICADCGVLNIGQGRRAILAEYLRIDSPHPLFMKAG